MIPLETSKDQLSFSGVSLTERQWGEDPQSLL